MDAGPGLWLSEVLGRDVVASDGRRLGRVADLGFDPGAVPPRVADVRFRRRRGPTLRARWGDVTLGGRALTLRTGARVDQVAAASAATPLLARDVLDAQIVDVAGKRLTRVSDVRLRERDGDLEVAGVDTGWRTVLRRIGLRRAGGPPDDVLDWSLIHLAAAGPAAGKPAGRLGQLSPSGLSELVARLPPDHGAAVLGAVEPAQAAGALSVARPRMGGRMMASLPPEPAGEILAAMPVDDAVAALRHVEAGRSAELLERLPGARAAELRRLLALHPRTAGGLMTTDIRTAAADEPLEAVRERLAADPPPLEGLATVFLHDADGRYAGAFTPVALLAGSPPRRLPALRIDTPVDDVIDLFAVQDVLALPVLDAGDRLVGAVAIDDVLEELLAERLPQHRRRYRRARIRERAHA